MAIRSNIWFGENLSGWGWGWPQWWWWQWETERSAWELFLKMTMMAMVTDRVISLRTVAQEEEELANGGWWGEEEETRRPDGGWPLVTDQDFQAILEAGKIGTNWPNTRKNLQMNPREVKRLHMSPWNEVAQTKKYIFWKIVKMIVIKALISSGIIIGFRQRSHYMTLARQLANALWPPLTPFWNIENQYRKGFDLNVRVPNRHRLYCAEECVCKMSNAYSLGHI